MLDLPQGIITVMRAFEPVFSERGQEGAKVLLMGALLSKHAAQPQPILS